MFFSVDLLLARNGTFSVPWLLAQGKGRSVQKVSKRDILRLDIRIFVKEFSAKVPEMPMSLSSHLLLGAALAFSKKVDYLHREVFAYKPRCLGPLTIEADLANSFRQLDEPQVGDDAEDQQQDAVMRHASDDNGSRDATEQNGPGLHLLPEAYEPEQPAQDLLGDFGEGEECNIEDLHFEFTSVAGQTEMMEEGAPEADLEAPLVPPVDTTIVNGDNGSDEPPGAPKRNGAPVASDDLTTLEHDGNDNADQGNNLRPIELPSESDATEPPVEATSVSELVLGPPPAIPPKKTRRARPPKAKKPRLDETVRLSREDLEMQIQDHTDVLRPPTELDMKELYLKRYNLRCNFGKDKYLFNYASKALHTEDLKDLIKHAAEAETQWEVDVDSPRADDQTSEQGRGSPVVWAPESPEPPAIVTENVRLAEFDNDVDMQEAERDDQLGIPEDSLKVSRLTENASNVSSIAHSSKVSAASLSPSLEDMLHSRRLTNDNAVMTSVLEDLTPCNITDNQESEGLAMSKGTKSGCELYHERQSRQLCALHVLNNLFQSATAFTQKELDAICHEMAPEAWINPHKSMLGLGNYDVNVIMAALEKRDLAAKWFDKRRPLSSIDMSQVYGFILNVPNQFRLLGTVPMPLIRQKHWIGIRRVGDVYYNLDSNLKEPKRIGQVSDLLTYLEGELQCPDKELILVITKEAEETGAWRRDSDRNCTPTLAFNQ